MGSDVQDLGPGGVIYLDLLNVLQIVRVGSIFLRIRDMGDDPPDRSNPGGFPPQGGPLFGGDAIIAQYGGALGIPVTGGGDVGGGNGGGGYIFPTTTEHHRPIYRDSSNIGFVYGGRAPSGSAGSMYMVGTVIPGLGGCDGVNEVGGGGG